MALTPQEIVQIAEPVEQIYEQCVNELLINIANHLAKDKNSRTAQWEIKKLGELGAITQESAFIISEKTGYIYESIVDTMETVAERACADIDPQLTEALENLYADFAVENSRSSPEIKRTVQAYVDQATDKLNLTGTTMLESTRQAYLNGIQTVVNEEQIRAAKSIVETQSFAVATGTSYRTQAIRTAMEQMAAEGIAGFYDRTGRKWSPEAYAAMVVRTTSHNAEIGVIRARQREYGGGDVFQISSHAGARPLCYPYQGGLYSWSGSGTFVDGDGKEHHYDDIRSTSYGEAAGIFGINCGHHPIPMIPNYSYLQDVQEQSPEENAKEYEESQIQRQYERNIRNAKRDLEIAKATNDPEAIKAAKQKITYEQARMRGFIEQTGRARRYDREQIGGNLKRERVEVKKPEAPKTEAPKFVVPTKEPNHKLIDLANRRGIKRVETHMMDKALTTEEIIKKLAGADKTKGSCASLCYAYAGNVAGVDVRDFRGGESQQFFSQRSTGEMICDIGGGKIINDTNDFRATKKLLEGMEKNTDYILLTGRHAAIVRDTGSKVEYLEMQSGWREHTFYELTDSELKRRFSCQKSHSFRGWGGKSVKVEWSNMLTKVDDLKDNENFRELLNYINTPENEQRKGKGGGEK